jgi:hypothetical protein
VPTGEGVAWFAGRPGDVAVFRVNRRPIRAPSLLTPDTPDDVYAHLVGVLAPGYKVVTGRAYQRVWRVGGLQLFDDERQVAGKLGWEPLGEDIVPKWSDEEKDWLTTATSPHGGAILPFVFDGDSRLLAIVPDRLSQPTTIAGVFERILSDQEAQRDYPTTEWGVEPILDVRDFLEWLRSVDVLESVSFAARLPNPDPRDAFRDLAQRMEARRATKHHERMQSDTDEGLVGIETDPDFRQAIAMGQQGFATLRGTGRQREMRVRYSQAQTVAHEHVEQFPPTWEGVFKLLRELARTKLRRFLQDDGG